MDAERENPGVVAVPGEGLLDVAPSARETVSQGFDGSFLEGVCEMPELNPCFWTHGFVYSLGQLDP